LIVDAAPDVEDDRVEPGVGVGVEDRLPKRSGPLSSRS
jgi:hypothetical protein